MRTVQLHHQSAPHSHREPFKRTNGWAYLTSVAASVSPSPEAGAPSAFDPAFAMKDQVIQVDVGAVPFKVIGLVGRRSVDSLDPAYVQHHEAERNPQASAAVSSERATRCWLTGVLRSVVRMMMPKNLAGESSSGTASWFRDTFGMLRIRASR